jgi:hypothetical protein
MDEQPPEVVESVGDFVLAESGGDFVVYATSRSDQIIGRFPGDEGGFARAEELFHALTGPYRRHRYQQAFLVLFFGALIVHVLSVAIGYLLQATQSQTLAFGESNSQLIALVERWSSTAAAISNVIWIAGLAGMAGLWLVRRVFPAPAPAPSRGGR